MKSLAIVFIALAVMAMLAGCGGQTTTTTTKTDPIPRTVTASDGLQYEDIKVGSGSLARWDDYVTVNYIAYLIDNTKVDSTMDPGGKPLDITLGKKEQITGLEEGIYGMRVGGQRRLTIPPELAFGDAGKPPSIPSGSSVVYYVELVAVKAYITTPSGLKYFDITPGTGAAAKSGDKISVNYTGWLTDWTKFDSSLDPGRTPLQITLGVGEVIKGWDEGLVGMKPGGKRRLIIPPALAYGSDGHGEAIPPDSTLIFDVQLVSIDP